jgi:hypothetical protein
MKNKCVLWENEEFSAFKQVVNIHYAFKSNAEINLFLNLLNRHVMKTYGVLEAWLHEFVTSVVVIGK